MKKIAAQLAASVVLGAGQFCTNSGLVLLIDSEAAEQFLTDFARQMRATVLTTMLNRNIYKAYTNSISALQRIPSISLLAVSAQEAALDRYEAQPTAHLVRADDFLADKNLDEEVFGPATLVILCADEAELLQFILGRSGCPAHLFG